MAEASNSPRNNTQKNLGVAIGFFATLGISTSIINNDQLKNPLSKPSTHLVQEATAIQPIPLEDIAQTRVYQSGNLQGLRVNGLFGNYLGVEGKIDEEISADFRDQLEKLWQKKLDRSNNSVVKATFSERVKPYIDGTLTPTRISLDDYMKQASSSIQQVRDNLDWDIVQERVPLGNQADRKLNILKSITDQIDAKTLTAYALTELMPSEKAQTNISVLDFLLRNAGREYVELIPAMYDKFTSFGPYQWTQYAVFDANGETRGASRVNRAIPKELRIPGSVIYLKGNDHHKAAFLNAVANLGDMIAGLNDSQLKVLERVHKTRNKDITEFIAGAHHSPANARKIAKRWLDNDAKLEYLASCHRRHIAYARKTYQNWEALTK